MSNNPAEKVAFRLYNLGWQIAIPLLRRNHRLAEGFDQRTLRHKLPPADLWIQAASAGESYLAWALLKNLRPAVPIRVMITTNTRQGMEIIERAIDDILPNNRGLKVFAAYFPFDKPAIMKKAVRDIRPKVTVLLESEIWPGFLAALKQHGCKILIINGRITPQSLGRYLVWPSFWQTLSPDKILAVSPNDAKRFATLFGGQKVEVMPNMKFDQLSHTGPMPCAENPLNKILGSDTPLLVLGSVRREEEPAIEKIMSAILQKQPQTVIGLFPRHMHRIKYWKKALDRLTLPWVLRSQTQTQVSCGTVILWDTFGELRPAYGLSKGAFVGGSLAPLGGQNFLEALLCGVIPVIGPFWEDFAWAGHAIVKQGFVREAANWREVADMLIATMQKSPPRDKIRKMALGYVKNRQGGTARACRLITDFLNDL